MSSDLLEQASRVIPSTQLLVTVISKRVRQLTQGQRPLVDVSPRMGYSDIALKEIVEGKLKSEGSEADRERLSRLIEQAASSLAPTLSADVSSK